MQSQKILMLSLSQVLNASPSEEAGELLQYFCTYFKQGTHCSSCRDLCLHVETRKVLVILLLKYSEIFLSS